MTSDAQLVAVAVIAKLLLLTERRVQQLAKAGVIPRGQEPGKYPLVGAVQGYIRYLQEHADGGDYQDERTKLTRIQRETAELDLARMRSEFVAKADVLRVFSEAMRIYRGEIDSMAARCASEFAGTSDAELIRQRMLSEERSARESAARRVATLFDGTE